MNTGILIGRFQAPYLSDAVVSSVNVLKTKHSRFAILLGESPLPGTKTNPYDFDTRKALLREVFAETEIIKLNDFPTDVKWSQNLDQIVGDRFGNEDITLYGSEDSVVHAYAGRFKLVSLPKHFDFTEDIQPTVSQHFREGILKAYRNQYDKVYPTVDIALFRNNRTEILLAKKEGVDRRRLVGGFADPQDESYESAAQRELLEECGDIKVSDIRYETSSKIDDWRYRFECDKIITLLFSCDYLRGHPHAKDDIVEVKWFLISELNEMIERSLVAEEHETLIRFLSSKYG